MKCHAGRRVVLSNMIEWMNVMYGQMLEDAFLILEKYFFFKLCNCIESFLLSGNQPSTFSQNHINLATVGFPPLKKHDQCEIFTQLSLENYIFLSELSTTRD